MTLPRTILQVLPALKSGGVERGTIEISTAIVKEGWTSLVTSSGGPMTPNVSYSGGEHILLPVDSKHPWDLWRNIGRLTRLIRRRKISLIHARSRAPAWSAYYAARRAGIPFVTTFHGVYGLEGFGKKRYNAIMTKGDRVIAVSRYVKRHIIDHYDCDHDKIKVIQRGADLNVFNPEKVSPNILSKLAQDWHMPDEHLPVIMLPGRISRWKGHETLIRALSLMKDEHFLCLMVGDGSGHPDFVDEMHALVKSLGLEGKVRFVGTTVNMREAYALADIIVAPSIEPEAFGRVSVEAQAMGKILIASNHGGPQETVVDGKTGFLIEPNNPDILYSTIRKVLDMSPPERYEIGNAAINNAWDHFSVEEMQKRTIAVYKELLNT